MSPVKEEDTLEQYPICDDYNMKSLISKQYDGNTIISEDLMELELSHGKVSIK